MIDQIHQQFIAVVKQGRGERLKDSPETFSGLFWNGEEAVKLGLADKLGNLDYVAREVVKAEEVIDYTPRDNVAERLAKRFRRRHGPGAVKALRDLPRLMVDAGFGLAARGRGGPAAIPAAQAGADALAGPGGRRAGGAA
jgi:protease-4